MHETLTTGPLRRRRKDAGMLPVFRDSWLLGTLAWSWLFLGAASGAAGVPPASGATAVAASPVQQEIPTRETEAGPTISRKQKRDLLKLNFEKMKRDADELADLAKSLQEDLSKSNENVLSLRIVEKAEKIEKLAKKIKNVARGY